MIEVSTPLLLVTVFILDTIFTVLLTIWTTDIFQTKHYNEAEASIAALSWVIFLFFNVLLFINI